MKKAKKDSAEREIGWVSCGNIPLTPTSAAKPGHKYNRGIRPASGNITCNRCPQVNVSQDREPKICSGCWKVNPFPYGAGKTVMTERIHELPDRHTPVWNIVCVECNTWKLCGETTTFGLPCGFHSGQCKSIRGKTARLVRCALGE